MNINTPEDLIKAVANTHGFSMEVILSPARHSELVDVRIKIIRVLKDRWGMTYRSIGRLMQRDHKTIMYLYTRPVKKLWTKPDNPVDDIK